MCDAYLCSQDSASHHDLEEGPPLIDMHDGEMSMELATPLPPTSLLPSSFVSDDSDSYLDPPSVPLPPSPEPQPMTPSTDSRALSPLSHTHSDIQLTTLDQLDQELAAANRKLREGEDEYRQLQRVVEDLQHQLDYRHPSAYPDLTL